VVVEGKPAAGILSAQGIENISRIHTYVFVSHDRGVGLIEFAGRESEYGWAGMESTLKSVVESLRWARFKFWVGFSCPSPLVT